MRKKERPVTSPCMSVCALDEDDVCIGCYRTANEITGWSKMSGDERRQVLRLAQQRGQEKNSLSG